MLDLWLPTGLMFSCLAKIWISSPLMPIGLSNLIARLRGVGLPICIKIFRISLGISITSSGYTSCFTHSTGKSRDTT